MKFVSDPNSQREMLSFAIDVTKKFGGSKMLKLVYKNLPTNPKDAKLMLENLGSEAEKEASHILAKEFNSVLTQSGFSAGEESTIRKVLHMIVPIITLGTVGDNPDMLKEYPHICNEAQGKALLMETEFASLYYLLMPFRFLRGLELESSGKLRYHIVLMLYFTGLFLAFPFPEMFFDLNDESKFKPPATVMKSWTIDQTILFLGNDPNKEDLYDL